MFYTNSANAACFGFLLPEIRHKDCRRRHKENRKMLKAYFKIKPPVE